MELEPRSRAWDLQGPGLLCLSASAEGGENRAIGDGTRELFTYSPAHMAMGLVRGGLMCRIGGLHHAVNSTELPRVIQPPLLVCLHRRVARSISLAPPPMVTIPTQSTEFAYPPPSHRYLHRILGTLTSPVRSPSPLPPPTTRSQQTLQNAPNPLPLAALPCSVTPPSRMWLSL